VHELTFDMSCLCVADTLVHCKDSKHFIVIHRGRYFKVYIHHKGDIFKPCEIEMYV